MTIAAKLIGVLRLACVLVACSSAGGSDGARAERSGSESSGGVSINGDGGPAVVVPQGGANNGPEIMIDSLRIEPEDAVLDIGLTTPAAQDFRVLAMIHGDGQEQDITARTVFYTADGTKIGSFADNGPLFETNARSRSAAN